MTRARIALLVAAFALLPWLAAQAAAQGGVARPFQGLFGGQGLSSTGTQGLDFFASLYGGYDDNVSAQLNPGTDPRLQVPSWLAGAGAGLTYSRRLSRRASLGASVLTNGAYLFDLDEVTWYGTNAGVGVGIAMGRKGQFRVGQSVAYQPSLRFGVLPPVNGRDQGIGIVQRLEPELSLAELPSWDYMTSVGYAHQFSRRLSFDSTYSFRYSNFVDAAATDFREHLVGARLSYNLWRFLYANAGYYYRFVTYLDPLGEDRSLSEHYLDAGLGTGYGKAWQWEFALGPKTTLSFGVGTSFTTAVSVADLKPRLGVNVVGNVLFSHWFNDRWRFQSGYDRRVGFYDWTFEPWMSDVVSASVNGYVSRRVSVSASTAYSLGSQIGGPGTYDTWFSTAQLQVALTQNTAVFAQYFYYRYLYEDTVLPVGLPSDFNRQGVRFGLTFWVPLLR